MSTSSTHQLYKHNASSSADYSQPNLHASSALPLPPSRPPMAHSIMSQMPKQPHQQIGHATISKIISYKMEHDSQVKMQVDSSPVTSVMGIPPAVAHDPPKSSPQFSITPMSQLGASPRLVCLVSLPSASTSMPTSASVCLCSQFGEKIKMAPIFTWFFFFFDRIKGFSFCTGFTGSTSGSYFPAGKSPSNKRNHKAAEKPHEKEYNCQIAEPSVTGWNISSTIHNYHLLVHVLYYLAYLCNRK